MKQFLLLFLLLFINTTFGQIPAGYYDDAQGLTSYQLKTALSSIISNGHTNRGYDNLYNGYVTTDSDHYYEDDGTVLDIYSENPTGPDPYNYTHNNNKCGNYSQEGDCYNREHLMPQSWFGSAQPMKSDIHHVVPSDGKVNGMRGHLPLADVANANWTSDNGSKRGSCADAGYTGTVFEPIDEFKGDIARIYFYMATRYEDEIGSWKNANDGSQAVFDGTNNHVFNDWYLQVLLQWHHQDPVSQREIDRNNAAYNYQGNRNPFIDHPEWVDAIWNQNPDTTPPSVPANVQVTFVNETSISISWDAATDDVAVAGYQVYLNNNLDGTTTDTHYTFTNLTPSTTYSICVKAKDSSGNLSECSPAVSATTDDIINDFIFKEDFDDCPNMIFVYVNEASDKNWKCVSRYGENDSSAIQINGYQEDVSSKDWLITKNPINFDNYNNESLSMFLAYAFGTTPLQAVYSTDYDGNGSPWMFTWLPIPNVNIPTPTGDTSITELTIDNADVSSLNGLVYLAFKYYSNGSPTRWTVDSVKLDGDLVTNVNTLLQSDLKIYPNPIHEGQDFRISSKDLRINNLYVYDTTGAIILYLENFKNQRINTRRYKKGVYFVQINSNKGVFMKKLIIE